MRNRSVFPWLAALCLGCAGGNDSSASTATIQLSTVVTLRGLDDSIDLDLGLPAISGGGLIAAPLLYQPSGAVGLYDSSGTFLRRIGRSGGGPGEFRRVQSVGFGPGDSLWVVDQMFFAHLFSPGADAQFVRTVRLARANTGALTSEGILSRGIVTSTEGLNAPHLTGWSGERRAEYGALEPAADMHDRMGALALVDSSLVWLARSRVYQLELLGSDGKVHRRLEREVDWFPPDTAAPSMPGSAPPRPSIHAISLDSEGRLWVLIRRGHRDWKPSDQRGPRPMVAPIQARQLPTRQLSEVFETVIEVLDPQTGRLIATRELGGGVLGFAAPGMLHEIEQGEMGDVSVKIHRLSLVSLPRAAGSSATSPGG